MDEGDVTAHSMMNFSPKIDFRQTQNYKFTNLGLFLITACDSNPKSHCFVTEEAEVKDNNNNASDLDVVSKDYDFKGNGESERYVGGGGSRSSEWGRHCVSVELERGLWVRPRQSNRMSNPPSIGFFYPAEYLLGTHHLDVTERASHRPSYRWVKSCMTKIMIKVQLSGCNDQEVSAARGTLELELDCFVSHFDCCDTILFGISFQPFAWNREMTNIGA